MLALLGVPLENAEQPSRWDEGVRRKIEGHHHLREVTRERVDGHSLGLLGK